MLAAAPIDLALESSYENLGFSTWKGVETLAKDHNGKQYLLAVNSAAEPNVVTWAGLGDVEALCAVGENRSLTVAKGAATDRFDAYEVHVYEMTGAGSRVVT